MRFRSSAGLWLLAACSAAGGCGSGKSQISGDELAWRTLVRITNTNDPTPSGESAAGWRFWNSKLELFPAKGGKAPGQASFRTYRPLKTICTEQALLAKLHLNGHAGTVLPSFNRQSADGFCEATFLNPNVASFVIDNGLFHREGLIRYLDRKGSLHFPASAIEIKTEWKALGANDAEGDYIVAKDGAVKYGLVALHLRSDRANNALWATWMHCSYESRLAGYPVTDEFGGVGAKFPTTELDSLLKAHSQRTWLKYRLIGTQTGFRGRASLGNPLIEGPVFPEGLDKVSCATCHSQAAINNIGGSSFNLHAGTGGPYPLPPTLRPLDSAFTLQDGPACQYGISRKCVNKVYFFDQASERRERRK